jgi:hypothetical protein
MINLPLEVLPRLLALSENPTFMEDVRYQLVGFTVVMLVLALLWGGLEVIGFAFRKAGAVGAAAAKLPAAAAEPGPTGVPPARQELEPEEFAVVAAAVYATLGSGHQIVSITTSDPEAPSVEISAWSAEGRREIYSSHRIR